MRNSTRKESSNRLLLIIEVADEVASGCGVSASGGESGSAGGSSGVVAVDTLGLLVVVVVVSEDDELRQATVGSQNKISTKELVSVINSAEGSSTSGQKSMTPPPW